MLELPYISHTQLISQCRLLTTGRSMHKPHSETISSLSKCLQAAYQLDQTVSFNEMFSQKNNDQTESSTWLHTPWSCFETHQPLRDHVRNQHPCLTAAIHPPVRPANQRPLTMFVREIMIIHVDTHWNQSPKQPSMSRPFNSNANQPSPYQMAMLKYRSSMSKV